MSDMTQTGFDYGALPVEVGISGRIIGERLRTRLKRTVQDIIESGKDLISIKPNLEGCFDAWFEHETGLDRQMAYKFIAAADRFGDGVYNNYTSLSPTVIYLLSAPSTPESVIEKALELHLGHDGQTTRRKSLVSRNTCSGSVGEETKPKFV